LTAARIVLRAAAAVAALVALSAWITPAAGVGFSPVGGACLDEYETPDADPFAGGSPGECDGDSTLGAISSVTFTLGHFSANGIHESLIFFLPPEWAVWKDTEVPDGFPAAELTQSLTVGLLNGACSTPLPVSFEMREATTDLSDTVGFGHIPFSSDPPLEQFEVIDGFPRGVTEYPDYLQRSSSTSRASRISRAHDSMARR
jgi:hypothetical protein